MSQRNFFFINPNNQVISGAMGKAFTPAPMGAAKMQMAGWVASEHFNFFAAVPPVYKKSVIMKTMPFMMEEYLIEPLDNYHFTIIMEGRSRPVSIFAATHNKMEEWRQLLDTVNLTPTALYPDILALPQDDECIHAHISKERALARTGAFTGFCGKGELFFALLEQQAKELKKDIKLYTDSPALVPKQLRDKVAEDKLSWLEMLEDSPLPNKAGDLLHGRHKDEQGGQGANALGLGPLGLAAAAALFAGLVFVNDFLSISAYKKQTAAIEQLSQDMYQQMFNQELGDVSQLRNRVLINLQQASGLTGDGEGAGGLWIRLRDLSDILANCSDCNLLEFKLALNSRRAEIVFESRRESANYADYFTQGGWRVLAWRSEEEPVGEDFYPVYTNRVVLEKNRESN